jgi:hypothetical protein
VTKKPLNLTSPLSTPHSEDELRVNTTPKAHNSVYIPLNLLPTFLNQNQICPHCPSNTSHTYLHCINDCLWNTATRTTLLNTPGTPTPMDTPELIQLLGGTNHTQTNKTDKIIQTRLIYALTLIQNSLILNPMDEGQNF